MDTGTRLLVLILGIALLVIVDAAWYRWYHLNALSRAIGRTLSGLY